ncbi:hypothetical protein EUTSA_v10019178mg [Eutrema salsugineum]|uniref:NAD(P)H-quinone oxidoreductase subunit O, chloroplastic n=1 Tax=Eutrema salsugineum TaxID=72664 RepID=V4JR11_EUTSA|nr:hypothetical protein EUTSA_v10019178mg [Eutrema salsugineum]
MAFSATLSQLSSLSTISSSLPLSSRRLPLRPLSQFTVKAEAEKEKKSTQAKSEGEASSASAPTKTPKTLPKKPVYSMKKGQIVRVEKEKYLNSINYLSVGHPPFYKGLDYIYEDRGEVLDIRVFETGEYALVGWVGIPTAPAWLPTDMLIKVLKTFSVTSTIKYHCLLQCQVMIVFCVLGFLLQSEKLVYERL